MPGVPQLNATLNLERERRFRLRANMPVMVVAGIDLGSNDEMFWFEVPERMSKTLYYARHDQYRQQLNRAILPVDPTWVMDALGLVQIDPSHRRRRSSQTRRRKTGNSQHDAQCPSGMYQRVCLIEPIAGYVTDQFLEDPSGKLIARCQRDRSRLQRAGPMFTCRTKSN